MPSVRAFYLVPKDKEINPDVPIVIANALRHLQNWYFKKLNIGKTFELFEPIVETIKMPHKSNWYCDNELDTDEEFWFFYNVVEDGFKLTGGKYYNEDFIWIYYIDASPKGKQYGGAGTSSVAVLHKDDIDGLLGKSFENVARWVGGLGHELGHAFGLDHPPECEGNLAQFYPHKSSSLMMHGFRHYPFTHLLEEDKEILIKSNFFHYIPENQEEFSPHDLLNFKPTIYSRIRKIINPQSSG